MNSARQLHVVIRSLRRSKVYTLTAVLTLALGIALVTAAFSLIDAVLLKPLPFAAPDRVVELSQQDAQGRGTGVSYPNFLDWEQQARGGAFREFGYARGRGSTILIKGERHPVLGSAVSDNFFRALQPKLLAGRLFSPDEAQRGVRDVVLSYQLWRDQFGADPRVLGSTVTLGDGDFLVIGILASGPVFPDWTVSGFYIPIATILASDRVLSARDFHADSRVIARLAPGITVARAGTELDAITKRLSVAYPAEDGQWVAAGVRTLRDSLIGDAQSQLVILATAMMLVLLIAWVNLTNLALVRGSGRIREMAIRTSLGASRIQIVRQLLLEQLLLALAAAVIGAVAATWVVGLLRGFAGGAPGSDTVHIDGTALGFAAGVAIVSALVIGALPAIRAARLSLTEPLREGGGSGFSTRQQRIRSALVAGEIALALMLVISAGLLVKSFWALSHVDPGFNTHGLVAIDLSPPGPRYAEAAQAGAFYTSVLAAVQAVPGVERAALTNHMPLNGAALPTSVGIPGRVADSSRDPQVLFRTLSPEYITTLAIPVVQGRNFAAPDLAGGNAVLINQTFAKSFFPGVDPLGRAVMLHKSAQGYPDYGEPLPGVVVGVIGDVHHFGLQQPPVPEIYIPYTRNPWAHMVVVARANGNPSALVPGIRRAILGVDPATVVTGGVFGGFEVIDAIRDGDLSGQRFNMLLLGGFALCALLLSAVGIYGLMAYAVAQRKRELGIRMALGARGPDVVRLIVGNGGRLIAVGVVVGLAGAFALTRLIASLLFGVSATDLPTFGITALVLAAVGFMACYLPARRAGRIDPVIALRE
ncbi:MAG TPA: ABC transporter permease [Gemmatimonadales bacterium]